MASQKISHDLVDDSVSETSPHILLHPLVLVSQDDHATRSNVRTKAPIIGAILGQYHGKEITMEFAFEFGSETLKTKDGEIVLDGAWFTDMLKLYGETFPSLTLVGWYAFGVIPTPWHARIQMQLRQEFECDSPIFLLYHWEQLNKNAVGGKLPFTLYESFSVQDSSGMEVDYVDESHTIKFRPITYSLETTDDEAIGLADIVHGATAAIATQQSARPPQNEKDAKEKSKNKSESKLDGTIEETSFLSPEDEDTIAFLTSRANAIKMLQSRIAVIIAYLKSQPASYLRNASLAPSSDKSPDHTILRSISALEAQLRLASPEDLIGIAQESEQSKTDVELISLLSSLTKSVSDVRTLTRRWGTIEPQKRKMQIGNLLGSQLPDTAPEDQPIDLV